MATGNGTGTPVDVPVWEGYCIETDVMAHLPGRNFYEADALGKTVVTLADLQGFITQIYQDINATLARLDFSLPLVEADSPDGYAILGTVNALGAAALAEEAWATAKGEVSERAERLRANYEKMLQRVWDHEIDLIDIGGGPAMPSEVGDSGSMDLTSAGAERAHWFTRETEW